MVRRHSDSQKVKEVQQLAKEHGMFVVDKGTRYLLFRKMDVRNVCIGTRSSANGIRQFVTKCAGLTCPRKRT